jgi:hypothetical protein
MAKNDSRKPPSGTSEAGDIASEIDKKQQEALKSAQDLLNIKQKQRDAEQEINTILGKQESQAKKRSTAAKQDLDALAQKAKLEKETLGTIEEQTRALLEQAVQENKAANAAVEAEDALMKKQEARFAAAKDFFKKEASHFVDIGKQLFPIQKLLSPSAYLDHALALDKAQASVVKTSGASREYTQRLQQIQRGVNGVNLSLEESAQLLSDVRLNYNKFALVEGTLFQETIEKNATILSKFGLSAAESTKQVGEIQSVMGESGDRAVDLQKKMVKAGQAIGMSATDITTKFTTSMDRFAMFGSKMGDQFIKMQSFSKAANLELDKTMSIAERASTFEGAAEIAGRINAIANRMILDPTKLVALAEDPQKQFEYIQNQLKGIDFKTMSAQQRRAYGAASQAAGIGSFTDLMKIVNAKPEDLRRMAGLAEAGAAGSDAELQKRASEAMTAQEKTTNAVSAFQTAVVDATGAIGRMHTAADAFAKGINAASQMNTFTMLNALKNTTRFFSNMFDGIKTKISSMFSGIAAPIKKVFSFADDFAKVSSKFAGRAAGAAVPVVSAGLSGMAAADYASKGQTTRAWLAGTAATVHTGGAIAAAAGAPAAGIGSIPGLLYHLGGTGIDLGLAGYDIGEELGLWGGQQQPAQDGEFDKSGILSSRSAGSFKPKMPAGVGGYVLTAGSMKPFSDKDKVTTSTSDLHVGQIAAAISEALSNTLNVRVINSDEMRGGSFSLSTV